MLREIGNQTRELLTRLKESSCTVVFTGAGVSAESGVPTFRGEDGLWKKFRAEDLATPEAFARDPKTVWEWYDFRRSLLATKSPNTAHLKIASWEQQYPGVHLVTQNVDGLHQRAGSRRVHCLHGDIWVVQCSHCGQSERNLDARLRELPPRCRCGGMQRPGVVWFGEALPQDVWSSAEKLCRSADLMFVIGTSALVYPAAGLPLLAKESGCFVVEVNVEPTDLTARVDLFLEGKAGEILGQL
ncbi:MAG TPA: NAD-dependent deacylase [Acidobacteriota bacterium]|nr:NAD-dependent deacylase [Acidobacteriota bacterium]